MIKVSGISFEIWLSGRSKLKLLFTPFHSLSLSFSDGHFFKPHPPTHTPACTHPTHVLTPSLHHSRTPPHSPSLPLSLSLPLLFQKIVFHSSWIFLFWQKNFLKSISEAPINFSSEFLKEKIFLDKILLVSFRWIINFLLEALRLVNKLRWH